MSVRVFHCRICGSTSHTARNHNGSAPVRSGSPKTKANNLWNHYRLPLDEYLRMLAGGCAVCGSAFEVTPDTDHDHSCDHPGKGQFSCRACVRGLLCRSCNLRVGAFERGQNDDPRIAAYLGTVRETGQPLALF